MLTRNIYRLIFIVITTMLVGLYTSVSAYNNNTLMQTTDEATAEITIVATEEPTLIVETATEIPTIVLPPTNTDVPTATATNTATATSTATITSTATPSPTIVIPTQGISLQANAVSLMSLDVIVGLNLYPLSHIYQGINNVTYTRVTNIGSFRPGYEEWQAPVYRVPADEPNPIVRVTNTYSGRVENWEVPTYAIPAPEADAHMAVINLHTGMVYEFWSARWTSSTSISAGGMVAFPINGNGISNPTYRRVTASGFANTNGSVMLEDFYNPATGTYDGTRHINHALTMNLPSSILSTGFVAPAVGGEEAGSAGSNGIPLGARFALPATLNVDTLNVHPFVRELLRAMRDYGAYVGDGSGSAAYQGLAAGTIETEPGLLQTVYGVDHNGFLATIQAQTYQVIQQYGIYRITSGTSVATATNTATNTSIPLITNTPRPSATSAVDLTLTNLPTWTPNGTISPTIATFTPTFTATPTATPSNTIVPSATSTIVLATNTVVPTLTATPNENLTNAVTSITLDCTVRNDRVRCIANITFENGETQRLVIPNSAIDVRYR